MISNECLTWLTCIVSGFLLGSIMFSQLIPKLFLQVDICKIGGDHNPGAGNVFTVCGPFYGLLCLSFDVLKGFFPIFIARRLLDPQQLLFAAVLTAPVLGHAIAPFNRFRGGKCISTAFGELLALYPITHIVLLLAGTYILLSTVLKIQLTRKRSIAAFSIFGILSFIILILEHQPAIALGCFSIALIAIMKHSKYFAYIPSHDADMKLSDSSMNL